MEYFDDGDFIINEIWHIVNPKGELLTGASQDGKDYLYTFTDRFLAEDCIARAKIPALKPVQIKTPGEWLPVIERLKNAGCKFISIDQNPKTKITLRTIDAAIRYAKSCLGIE